MTRSLEDVGEHRGLFVVFEGLDGSGTTTQASLLAGWLGEHGRVELTHEPSAGPIGGLTRSVIDGRLSVDPSTLALMFAADRLDHLTNSASGILGTLAQGVSVVSDRYVLSSLAYQSAQGLSVDWVRQINAEVHTPDVTIYVETSVDICVERIRQRRERAELFHERQQLVGIESAYRRVLADRELVGELVTVDGDQAPPSVAHQIQAELRKIAQRKELAGWQRLRRGPD